ncbi:MAG TPA: hypothetical protein VHS31_13025 [Tepidisphaeraceae bacterium]|nr:hypothetical protein [Tepidisphaeraceae bacterium]
MNTKPTILKAIASGMHLYIAVICCAMLMGCEEPRHTSPAASQRTSPTTQPTAPILADAATTTPVNTPPVQPVIAETVFQVDGVLYHFPRARVHLDQNANTAVLYSDDPKSAIEPGYVGNSFYLVIPLDKAKPLQLDHYQWDYRSGSGSERRDSTDGIFLNGQRYHLQPQDVHVAFLGNGPAVKFWLWGQFEKFDAAQSSSHIGYDAGASTPLDNNTPTPQDATLDTVK